MKKIDSYNHMKLSSLRERAEAVDLKKTKWVQMMYVTGKLLKEDYIRKLKSIAGDDNEN